MVFSGSLFDFPGKKISQLGTQICLELAKNLDNFWKFNFIKNWKKLARYFGFSSKEISLLENGGTAHNLFFIKLLSQKPDITLFDIKIHLESIGRRSRKDIFFAHEERKPSLIKIMHKPLGNLTSDEFDIILKEVASELCEIEYSKFNGCWKDLASKIDSKLFNRGEIRHIKNCGKAPINYSPCTALIEILSSREETVLRLMEGLKHIKRNDVFKYLKREISKGECWETDE